MSKKRRGHAGGEITPAWFLWYGMRVGLTMDETLDIPFGDLLTLIAVEQIKREGCRQKRKLTDDEIIPDVR